PVYADHVGPVYLVQTAGNPRIAQEIPAHGREGLSCKRQDLYRSRSCFVVDHVAPGGNRRDDGAYLDAGGAAPLGRDPQHGVPVEDRLPKLLRKDFVLDTAAATGPVRRGASNQ